jgi:N-dimethylarginine dimethylaminohydrolase
VICGGAWLCTLLLCLLGSGSISNVNTMHLDTHTAHVDSASAVAQLGLLDATLSVESLLQHHASEEVREAAAQRRFNGPTLAYVTPW